MQYGLLRKENRGVIMQDDPFNAIEYVNDPNTRAEILRTICVLPDNLRVILLLYYYGGLRIQEIAAAMNVPVGVVNDQLESARRRVFKELGMKGTYKYTVPDKPKKSLVLKEIFDKYAEETSSDEQIQRVLEPVLRMIAEGKFDKPWWYRFKRFVKPLVVVAVISGLILLITISSNAL